MFIYKFQEFIFVGRTSDDKMFQRRLPALQMFVNTESLVNRVHFVQFIQECQIFLRLQNKITI